MASSVIFALLCPFVLVVVLVAILLISAIKTVPYNENWVVTRLGETSVRGPGRTFQIPIVDQVVRVDLSEKTTNIQDQTCITSDRAPVIIHMLVYSRAIEPVKVAAQTNQQRQDFMHLASSTLKEMVSARPLNQVLSARDELGAAICEKLSAEVGPSLGVRIEKVKVMEVVVSNEILAAMPAPGEIPSECPACGAPVNAQGNPARRPVRCEYCGFLMK